MRARRLFLTLATLGLTTLLGLSLFVADHTIAASPRGSTAPTQPMAYRITAGWGDDDYVANIYTPRKIEIYAGDTVTWHGNSAIESHTISFGPRNVLAGWAKQIAVPIPQKAGPPLLALNPNITRVTHAASYAGFGVANSGVLVKGQRWSLTFPKPGVYRYYCLLHFPGMAGVVVVSPRPARSHLYQVQSGYGSGVRSFATVFFPEKLTIHVGDTVNWSAGFHTVTFGPPSLIQQLRQHFILPVPQKSGPPEFAINPRIAFPTGGPTYDGTGFWNSGLLLRGPTRLTFSRAGIFHYACLNHVGMDGTITVLP